MTNERPGPSIGEAVAEQELPAAELAVSIDQDSCTGDGLCVQYAPDVFELDLDGLAYVKDDSGVLQLAPGSRVPVPPRRRLEVIEAARDCPGTCIHVTPSAAGPPITSGQLRDRT